MIFLMLAIWMVLREEKIHRVISTSGTIQFDYYAI